MSGGNRSGVAIGAVDWEGNVTIDQFTRSVVLGNVRERRFGDIWSDPENALLAMLRDRKRFLEGRCAACVWLPQCNGNFRARGARRGRFLGPRPDGLLPDG